MNMATKSFSTFSKIEVNKQTWKQHQMEGAGYIAEWYY